MGKHPNKADSLTPVEEEHLWNSQQLGAHNARSLINSMWYLLTQHFGLRGRQEHHTMKVEDFITRTDEQGSLYITFSETYTKTRPG